MGEEKNKVLRSRESLRVALSLKKLLVKICAVQTAFKNRHGHSITHGEVADVMKFHEKHGLIVEQIPATLEISKEIFMLFIQNQEVQQIMNDLDLPPERAHLFEVMDADGSGELRPSELLNGLLKVLGDAR